jgi:transcriptional regulator
MYIPELFRITDDEEIESFLRENDFATIVTPSYPDLMVTHLPVVVRREAKTVFIAGHVSRANRHWQLMDGRSDSLVIFQGPHHYVSPSWYTHSPAVPTWNYAVVHAYGKPEATHDAAVIERILAELTARYESGRAAPWSLETVPSDFYRSMLSGIVGFQMEVVKVEAKFKLSQDRRPADQDGTIAGLEREGTPAASRLAEFMRNKLQRETIQE